MAQNGTIWYDVKYKNDSSSLNKIRQEINEIRNLSKEMGFDRSALYKAKEAAEALGSALNKAYNQKLDTVNIQTFTKALDDSGYSLKSLENNLKGAGVSGQNVFRSLSANILSAKTYIQETNQTIEQLRQGFVNAVKYQAFNTIIGTIQNKIIGSYDYIKKLDSSLNDIRVVTGKSAEDMTNFAVQANNAAEALGRQTTDYTNAALIYYQQGLSENQANTLAETTLKIANVTQQTTSLVSEEITAVMNGYGYLADDMESKFDKLAAVAASTASDLGEISSAISKVASTAAMTGVDLDSLIGQISTIISVTRQAPESVGTALKTIFARIQDLKEDGTDEFGVSLGRVSGHLHAMGIQILDQSGNIRQMDDIIQDIAAHWENWSQAQRMAAAEAIGGKRQYNNLVALFDNWDKYLQSVNTSLESEGTLEQQQAIYMESLAAKVREVSAAWEGLIQAFTDGGIFADSLDAVKNILEVIKTIVSTIGSGSLIGQVGSLLMGSMGAQAIGGMAYSTIRNNQNNAFNIGQYEAGKEFRQEFSNISNQDIKLLAQYRGELETVRSLVTEETVEEVQGSIKRVAQLKNELAVMQQKKKKAQEFVNLFMHVEGVDPFSVGGMSETDSHYTEDLKSLGSVFKKTKKAYLQLIDAVKKNSPQEEIQELYETTRKFFQQLKSMSYDAESPVEQLYEMFAGQNDFTDQQVLKKLDELHNTFNNGIDDAVDTIQAFRNGTVGQMQSVHDNTVKDLSNISKAMKQAFNAQVITQSISALSQIGFVIASIVNVVKQFSDETKTTEEKANSLITYLLSQLPMVLMGFQAIMRTIKGIKDSLSLAAVQAGVSIGAILLPMALIAAAIATVTLGLYQGYKAWNKYSDEVKESNKTLEDHKKKVNEYKNEIQNIKTIIKEYQNQINALQDLDKETEEYQEALEKANEKARQLADSNEELAKSIEKSSDGLLIFKNNAIDAYETAVDKQMLYNDLVTGAFEIQVNNATIANNLSEISRSLGKKAGLVNAIPLSLMEDIQKIATATGNTDKNILDEVALNDKQREILFNNWDAVVKILQQNSLIVDNTKAIAESQVIKGVENSSGYQGASDFMKEVLKNNPSIAASIYENRQNQLVSQYNQLKGKGIITNDQLEALNERLWQQYFDVTGNTYLSGGHLPFQNYEKRQRRVLDQNGNISTVTLDDVLSALIGNFEVEIEDKTNKAAQSLHDFDENFQQIIKKIKNTTGVNAEDALTQLISGNSSAMLALLQSFDEQALDQFVDAVVGGDHLWTILNRNADELKTYFQTTADEVEQLFFDVADKRGHSFADVYIAQARKAAENAKLLQEIYDEEDYSKLSDEAKAYYDQLELINKVGYERKALLRELAQKQENEANANYRKTLADLMNEQARLEVEYEKQKTFMEAGAGSVMTGAGELTGLISEHDTEEAKQNLEEIREKISQIRKEADEAITLDFNTNVDQMYQVANDWKDLADLALQEIEISFEDAQKLIEEGHGAMLAQAKATSDKTIALNRSVVKAYVEGKAEELEADRQAKLAQIESERAILKANLELTDAKIANLEKAAETEDAAAAATMLAQAKMYDQDIANNRQALTQKEKDSNDSNETMSEQAKALTDVLADYDNTVAMNAAAAADDAANSNEEFAIRSIEAAKQIEDAYIRVWKAIRGESTEAGVQDFNQTSGSIVSNYIAEQADAEYQALLTDYEKLAQSIFDAADGQLEVIRAECQRQLDSAKQERQNILSELGMLDSAEAALNSAYKGYKAAKSTIGSETDARKAAELDKTTGSEKTYNHSTIAYLNDTVDIYKQVNREISNYTNLLNTLQRLEKKVVGNGLIDNYNQQLIVLKRQEDAYKRKLSLAKQDLQFQVANLSALGAVVGADGQILNYAELLGAKQAEINAMIAEYNAMTGEQQANEGKALRDKIEEQKAIYNNLKSQMDAYDKVYDSINDIQSKIDDIADQVEELNIKKFHVMVDVKLDLADAEKEWNEFRKKCQLRLGDNNFLGDAKAELQNFYILFKQGGQGIITELKNHVSEIMKEINIIKNGGISEIYGQNLKQALEDLKSYNSELMDYLELYEDTIKQVWDDYLDQIEKTNQAFDARIKNYEYIQKLISHDITLIQKLNGEGYNEAVEKFYREAYAQRQAQYAAAKEQSDYYGELMKQAKAQRDAYDEGTAEWEKANEAYQKYYEYWQDSTDQMRTALEDMADDLDKIYEESAKRIKEQYENALLGMSAEGASEIWSMNKDISDKYYDSVERDLNMQSLNNEWSKLLKNYDAGSKAQKEMNDLMQRELKALEGKEYLTEKDIELAKARIAIKQAELALDDAQNNKSKLRLRRDSQGNYTYQYVADEDNVAQAQEDLIQKRLEWYEKDKELRREATDYIIKLAQEEADKINEINNDLTLSEEERQQRIEAIHDYYTKLRELAIEEYAFSVNELQDGIAEHFEDVDQNEIMPEFDQTIGDIMDRLIDDPDSVVNEVEKMYDDFEKLHDEYMEELENIKDLADEVWDQIKEGEDQAIEDTEELIDDNNELINTYVQEEAQLIKVIVQLDNMRKAYENVRAGAVAVADAAHKMYEEINLAADAWRDYADAAREAISAANSGGYSGDSGGFSGGSGGSGDGGSGGSGDGGYKVVSDEYTPGGKRSFKVGDRVKYVSGLYYYTSYGDSPTGSRGPGKYVTITDIKEGRPKPIHVRSDDSAYGWLTAAQLSFKSGGYTGEWARGDEDGKLAWLHQKELVLNSSDTQNILDAVNIAKLVSSAIGNLGGDLKTGLRNMLVNKEDNSSQNVTVYADFPNAASVEEIKEAFSTLPSLIQQKMHLTRRAV